MKNIVIWPREVDVKMALLGLAALVGSVLSILMYDMGEVGVFVALMAVPIAVFIWAVFELIKPSYFTPNWRRWQITELCVVPLVLFILMVVFAVWCHYQVTDLDRILEDITTQISA